MKRYWILVALFLFAASTGFGQQGGSFADNFIRGYEAGTRAKYYQEQMRMLELQRKQMELEFQRAQKELQEKSAKPNSQQKLTDAQQKQIADEAQIDMEIFTAKRPDWKQYESKMVYFGRKLLPQNLSAVEYLDYLYILAKTTATEEPK